MLSAKLNISKINIIKQFLLHVIILNNSTFLKLIYQLINLCVISLTKDLQVIPHQSRKSIQIYSINHNIILLMTIEDISKLEIASKYDKETHKDLPHL